MNTVTKPIKRSRYLAPLSREHHDDLLFSWKVHRGLAMHISPERIALYCNWFYETHLKNHFRKEEKSFAKILRFDDPMIIRMLDDHELITIDLNLVNVFPTAERLERLARMLSAHVRFEERELFNYVESIATPNQLEEILNDLTAISHSRKEWIDEFWISSN